MNNSGFFKEVLWNLSSYYSATTSEFHFQIFSKSAWVIIYDGACIPKCFYEVVHLENLLLQSPIISLYIKKILLQIMSNYSNTYIFRCFFNLLIVIVKCDIIRAELGLSGRDNTHNDNNTTNEFLWLLWFWDGQSPFRILVSIGTLLHCTLPSISFISSFLGHAKKSILFRQLWWPLPRMTMFHWQQSGYGRMRS